MLILRSIIRLKSMCSIANLMDCDTAIIRTHTRWKKQTNMNSLKKKKKNQRHKHGLRMTAVVATHIGTVSAVVFNGSRVDSKQLPVLQRIIFKNIRTFRL